MNPGIRREPLTRHTHAYRVVCVGLFLTGFSIFSLLYSTQALLPLFASYFQVSPAQSSLVISVATAAVAISIFLAGSLSDHMGRKPMVVSSLFAAAICTLLAALAPSWTMLLWYRVLTGLAVGGVPAVLMAYMAEEIDPDSLGLATGVYIAGSVFGGMSGRLVAGLLADYLSWRVALGTLGTVSLCGAAYCLVSLPPSQQHRPQHRAPSEIGRRYLQPLQDAGLPWIFFGGFLLMGAFVTLYNYMTFRLLAAPYRLSQSAASWIFSIYLIGMASSTIAGALAGRLGRRKLYWPAVSLMLVGVLCTLAGSLWIVVPGIGLVTFGFFAAHSLASSWVSLRGRECRAQAASLYLCSFYLGSSVAGSLGGLVWSRHGWNGVVLMVALMVAGAFLVSLRLARLPPLPRGPVATDAVTVSG